jgi:OHCU decarboxylase
MPVSVDRIRADIEAIARCTATPDNGATRPTFSAAWAEARAYVIAQAEAVGCVVRTDAAGNVHARPAALGWDAPTWLVGSHIDTVPRGGDYDGVAGVVVGLELLRSAKEDGLSAVAVELIAFAEEEGPTFGLGMLGSRAWVGDLSASDLAKLKNVDGQTYLEAGAPYGVDPAKLLADPLVPSRYLGLIEVHIEQGPGMWRRDQRLAVVTAIAGRHQYRAAVHGEANHAGATAMGDRKDAVVAAAEVITALESAVKQLDPAAVLTVGRLDVSPNAVNVIADRVEFTIDFRAPADDLLRRGGTMIRAMLDAIMVVRGLRSDLAQTENAPARPMDLRLVAALRSAGGAGAPGGLPTTVSGALHDSAILAPHLPTAMLFVPSKDGISHNPAEFSRVEDIAAAAAVVERLVRRPTLGQLNAMGREAFAAVVGHVFEHSPWIAERAWDVSRPPGGRPGEPRAAIPFASVANLHERLCAVVATASADEQVGLVAAHPDLVGRLAREGRLTRESTAEQAAAGLTALSADEVAAFERHNADYRAKFGFPFVVCARENKKEAILAAFPRRLANTKEQEIAAALAEIYKIAKLRLADAIWEP